MKIERSLAGQHRDRSADAEAAEKILDIGIPHPHAAVGHRLAHQFLRIGAMDAHLIGSLRQGKPNPVGTEGVVEARADRLPSDGMLPDRIPPPQSTGL